MKKFACTGFFLPVLFFSLNTFSQTDSSQFHKTGISYYFISGGPFFATPVALNLYSPQKLSSRSLLYNQASHDISNSWPDTTWNITGGPANPGIASETGFALQAGVCVRLKAKDLPKKSPPYFKLGFSYFSRNTNFININSTGIEKSTYNAYLLNGNSVTRDSIKQRELLLSYSSQNLNTEANFLISTYQQNRLVLYGGAGVFVGINFAGTANFKYTALDSLSDHTPGGQQVYFHYTRSTQEQTLRNGPGFTFGAIANLGLDINLKRSLAAFIEYQFRYRSQLTEGFVQTGNILFQFNLGIKYALKQE